MTLSATRAESVADHAADATARLVGLLADGSRHELSALARHVLGHADEPALARMTDMLEALRSSGMAIAVADARVRADPFVPLAAGVVATGLPHWHVAVVGTTSSTNSDLVRALRDGDRALPSLRATEVQSAGRGRLGRTWRSAPGISLTASFALEVSRRPSALDGATLVCGLAVRDVATAEGVAARLKWPNDVLVDDRKLAGILVEIHALDAERTALVVGIGLNVGVDGRREIDEDRPEGNALPVTDLVACGARHPDRNRLLVALARALEARFAIFASEGFAPFAAEWRAADALRDRVVTLTPVGHAPGARTGIARGVDLDGTLRFEVDGIVTRVRSGDVSLRFGDGLEDPS